MNWIVLLTAMIRLVLELVKYLERRSIIAQAEASQLEALMERAHVLAAAARKARSAVNNSDSAVVSDPLNRDSWPDNKDESTGSSNKDSGV